MKKIKKLENTYRYIAISDYNKITGGMIYDVMIKLNQLIENQNKIIDVFGLYNSNTVTEAEMLKKHVIKLLNEKKK